MYWELMHFKLLPKQNRMRDLRRPQIQAAELVFAKNLSAKRNTGTPWQRPLVLVQRHSSVSEGDLWLILILKYIFGWRLKMLKRQVIHEVIC